MTGRTVLEIRVSIPRRAVLRRLGYPPDVDQVAGPAHAMIEDLFEQAPQWIHGRGIAFVGDVQIDPSGSARLSHPDLEIASEQVARLLKPARYAALLAVTIGPELEDRVLRLMDSGEATRSVILDAIGSEAADAAADWLHHQWLKDRAAEEDLDVTARFSPGYGDWPVTIQQDLIQCLGGEEIGITVSESSLMHPRKSVSAVLGLVPRNPE